MATGEKKISNEKLDELVARQFFTAEKAERIQSLSRSSRTSVDWQNFLSFFLLTAATAFVSFGLVFFFAFNWQQLPPFIKMAIPLAGFLLIQILQHFFIQTEVIRKILAFFQIFAIGIFLAVFGQIYQTGADSYELFQAWLLFSLPLLILYNYSACWFLGLLLLNLYFNLLIAQEINSAISESYRLHYLTAIIVNLPALIATEWYYLKQKKHRWFSFSVFLFLLTEMTFAVISVITRNRADQPLNIVLPLFYLIFAGSYFWWSFKIKKSLAENALILISLISIIFIWTAETIIDLDSQIWIIAAEFFILSFLATKLLMGLGKRMKIASVIEEPEQDIRKN